MTPAEGARSRTPSSGYSVTSTVGIGFARLMDGDKARELGSARRAVRRPGAGGCNPIPPKIEIRWSCLAIVPALLYNSIRRALRITAIRERRERHKDNAAGQRARRQCQE